MWTKHVNYELANRIPVIIKHPEIKEGHHSMDLLETVDLYPTLAELAALPLDTSAQPIDGLSFASYLTKPESPVRTSVYHCFPRGGKLGRAIRTEDFRLVAWQDIEGRQEVEYELYEYKDGLIETENIWSPSHPAFLTLKAILDKQPDPAPLRPESKKRK